MRQNSLKLAALFGATAVILGAFGAHALKNQLTPKALEIFQTGVTYQFNHALALLGLACLPGPVSKWYKAAQVGFVVGSIAFSGSLYLLACRTLFSIEFLTPVLGPITPLGGTCFIIAWACLFVHAKNNVK
jgi:uncharacterized membrane protein YgdD (TMEM256/DUF423 family)